MTFLEVTSACGCLTKTIGRRQNNNPAFSLHTHPRHLSYYILATYTFSTVFSKSQHLYQRYLYHPMGPSQNVAESSNEEARRQEYWHAIAAQKSSSNVRSSTMIDSKWVHQIEVPTVLNHLRLHDPISIVFDPTDATFAVLNSSLIYGKLHLLGPNAHWTTD